MKKHILLTVLVFTVVFSPALVSGQTLNLDYSTYLGGTGNDYVYGIGVGSDGKVYITGSTNSSDFPTANPYEEGFFGASDVFVSALTSTGASLFYSTYLGGSGSDNGFGISVGADGMAYVTGYTGSSDFPTESPYQAGLGGSSDAFVSVLSSSGSALSYSTYLGGSSLDWGVGVSLGTDGMVYLTGLTQSSDFPTENPYQPAHGGGTYDAFVSVLSSSGLSLFYSTYLGGSESDYGAGIRIDSGAVAYVAGYTESSDFPTENPYQGGYGGGRDAFVTALASTGMSLTYSTYLGGSAADLLGNNYGNAISLGMDGVAFVVGETQSLDFPTKNSYQATRGGGSDAFVSALTSTGSTLSYSTYLGGGSNDSGNAISVNTEGEASVIGFTMSSDFPTQNPYQAEISGSYDAFVTALTSTGTALSYSTYLGGSALDFGRGISLGTDNSAVVVGSTQSSDFPMVNPYQAARGGGYDAFVSRLALPIPTPTCGPAVPVERNVVVSGDYDGDDISDIAIFRESAGLWAIRGITRAYFGTSGDQPASGDYDGDGTSDLAVFREATGLWAIRGLSRIYYGVSGDLPGPGDYNGDGICDIAVFRPSTGLWAARGVTRSYFGTTGDLPAPGDYSGSGMSGIALFRPSTGLWAIKGVSRVYFGGSQDWPIPGDYDGDGIWNAGIFRGATGLWAIRDLTRIYYGCCPDRPIPADYDGSGTDDIGIFRGWAGLWSLRGVTRVYYGVSGDVPVTR